MYMQAKELTHTVLVCPLILWFYCAILAISCLRSFLHSVHRILHLFLPKPWLVSSYLSCGGDLIKIMRNELLDQDLLPTRHGLDPR